MGPFIALAFNGFREARRNRVTLLVGLFALALLLSTSLVVEVTVVTFDRVLTDVGLGAMSLMLVLLTIFLSSGLISREIERRTIFLMVSKPLSRGSFLVGRLLGNMLTVTVLQLAMAALYCLLLLFYGSPLTTAQLAAMGMLWFELWVLSGVGFLMSSFSSQMVSAFVTVSVYVAGNLSSDVFNLLRNAFQAVGAGGTVRVTLRQEEGQSQLGIWDSAGSIPAAHLSRIFEPFFSTREGGSGLGLSTAHSLVRAHGGTLQVTSSPREGTEFLIHLPLHG